ncbi:5-oxoprolinase (ATP-hydrolysing) [Blastomyces gilchristii SLH14081]|uniref:5-oxoprolinase (ATP-hydrolysing) n=1 Tax=Blastomyces gilchristii (strain SLH14081) TaxID=559298 RepID=A0A179UB21_BLAGS|nr:5-oxoprolinase (ATP-hydrolysing) [Blastomyces gilchristii SLH14081]OAT03732.1 5-oxoprolinase (ATP-hydrolysing) [Blastomyces gilchristii SLH14081]
MTTQPPPTQSPARVRISIDRGGTFTDVHASIPGRSDIILKLLSVDPSNYKDAPTEGIRRVLEIATGKKLPRGQQLDLAPIESLRMGTTVATNALLERKGARSALLISKGFKDLLVIGNQSRPNIFDLSVAKPSVLYEKVVEINERVTLKGYTEDPDPQPIEETEDVVRGTTGEYIHVLVKPDMKKVRDDLQMLWDEGYRSIAIVLLHSYTYPAHEKLIGQAAMEMGFSVAISSELQPMIKVVPRGMSATADAYLTPVIKEYIDSISSNFIGGLASPSTRCEFMQSDGGLVDFRKFSGLKAILSGPAGGVVGYAQTSWDDEEQIPVIGFDMGGTSTDVSRYSGVYDHVFETTIAGVSIQSPQLDINTVAAGGGSILFWRNGLFAVGPESASAHPGPACYRKGGPLTVTDANLFLGRLLPGYFPKIFGPNEDEPLDVEITRQKFTELTEKINSEQRSKGWNEFTPEEVALGFLSVANESMSRPIRALTEARGYDTSVHHLSCFGGAGGQHACSVASVLGISRVIIHKYSSILSAYGMALADVVHEATQPTSDVFSTSTEQDFRSKLEALAETSTAELESHGFSRENIRHEMYLNMRHEGTSTALMILKGDDWDFGAEFNKRHKIEFGFLSPDKRILVDDIRVRSIASSSRQKELSPYAQMKKIAFKDVSTPGVNERTMVYFGTEHGWVATPVLKLEELTEGSRIQGPAMIIDQTQTIVLVPGAVASILESCVVIDLKKTVPTLDVSGTASTNPTSISPIQLSIFGNRFMSIAEQMGRTLQKTSVSTNIKERLDFSCALFSPDGGLVANAPHVPVHLGSMQFAVRYQHKYWAGNLEDGDVLISNHPSCGGTHLPDITVITPVFDQGEIVFYVASRGHHADIGGCLPGSMPPTSTELWQEGAAIEAEKLVAGGVFNEERMTEILLKEPAQYPGCSGTRCLQDNLSDLRAQVAANQKGISLINGLIKEYGLERVHTYMYAIQSTAEIAVRELLKTTSKTLGSTLEAVDYMDDGTTIALKITIDGDKGEAVFDFSGTGCEVFGNTNAPTAITHSAIIYCLRSLVKSDIPLNQGCLNPIDIRIPPGTLLSPSKSAGVVGGNVLTSQRITDVVLKAFNACAASQGCCNNLTFGKGGKTANGEHVNGFGYYETIAGGSGAGPTWVGQSGIHTHMTNTRITDPEIFEKRYPCILREFSIRKGSGGQGAHPGGDGVVRDIEFLIPVQCSILSERRSHQPYGLQGGGPGASGKNLWIKRDEETGDERMVSLGAKATVAMGEGDRIVVQTPGGGAWGSVDEEKRVNAVVHDQFLTKGSVDRYRAIQETN